MNAPTVIRQDGRPRPAEEGTKEDGVRRVGLRFLVAVLSGAAAYVLTNVISPSGDDLWRVVVSVLFSGAILIVQFMLGFVRQLADLKGVVEQRFIDIGKATKLFNEVEKLRDDGVPRLAESATRVVSIGPTILHDFAHEEINRVASQMEDLTNLSAECQGENHDWLLSLTKCAAQTIDAISTSAVDRDFWNSEPAGRYLQAQSDAIDRQHVKVRRLFIVRKPADIVGLDQLCDEQKRKHIDVRVVALSQLPLYIRRGKMVDFVVFDDSLIYQINADQMSVNSSTTVSAREKDVRELIRRFNDLWDASPANGLPAGFGTPAEPPEGAAT
ncbi:hypothetical protein [Streptomyces prunicolor]|uniref:hypothetical protein n=1 Tax=Streptomyces prunicolor TaxID=67348 RepID=UPI00157ACADF|nr:hypothetical protein [Streptomyces prunicolor]